MYEIYKDDVKFSENVIKRMRKIFMWHDVYYAQIFGSYLEESFTGCYNDIDILVMSFNDKNLDLEKLNLDMKELIDCEIDCVPYSYVDMMFKSSVIDSAHIIYFEEEYLDTISNKIEKVLRWGATDGVRNRLMLKEYIDRGNLLC